MLSSFFCVFIVYVCCIIYRVHVFHGVVQLVFVLFFFQAEDGIRDLVRSRGLGDVYKRQYCDGAEDAAPPRSPPAHRRIAPRRFSPEAECVFTMEVQTHRCVHRGVWGHCAHAGGGRDSRRAHRGGAPVSYTHLTLPTSDLV